MITSASKLLVVAAAACGAALAQPTDEVAPTDSEQLLLEQIDQLRAAQGLNAEGQIAPLRGLALLYQESGDHVLAVNALEEARQVLRAKRGLRSASVEEALLLQQQIRSEKALGNGERVWNLQYDLIIIARQHLDDMQMLPVFLEIIDDRTERFDVFSTTDFGDLPPGLFVPCDPDVVAPGRAAPVFDARACPFGTWRMVVDRLRGAVLRNYADAIGVLLRNGDYTRQELRDLEKKALGLVPFARGSGCAVQNFAQFLESELVDTCLDPVGRFGGWVGGWDSLIRLVYYEVRGGAPAAPPHGGTELADAAAWLLEREQRERRNALVL